MSQPSGRQEQPEVALVVVVNSPNSGSDLRSGTNNNPNSAKDPIGCNHNHNNNNTLTPSPTSIPIPSCVLVTGEGSPCNDASPAAAGPSSSRPTSPSLIHSLSLCIPAHSSGRLQRAGSASSSLSLRIGSTTLTVPQEKHLQKFSSTGSNVDANIKPSNPAFFEEDTHLIHRYKSIATSIMGAFKSFSTNDMRNVPLCSPAHIPASLGQVDSFGTLRSVQSDPTLCSLSFSSRPMDNNSRTCSMWVGGGGGGGDSVCYGLSQLVSPQLTIPPSGGDSFMGSMSGTGGANPDLTALNFVRSANKRIRQMYVRKRVTGAYRALDIFSRNHMDVRFQGLVTLGLRASPSIMSISALVGSKNNSPPGSPSRADPCDKTDEPIAGTSCSNQEGPILDWDKLHQDLSCLSVTDVDMQKGKPLTKYERNMMIFNWLQEVDQPIFPVDVMQVVS